jgi:hypothetical protein
VFEFLRRISGQRARRLRDCWSLLLVEDRAFARGERLLREWLSPDQRAQLDALGYFDVAGCDTGKKYRIRAGTSTNVEELDDNDVPAMGWCFVPRGYLVQGDVMLAQKISLETSEQEALAVAKPFPPSSAICRLLNRPF